MSEADEGHRFKDLWAWADDEENEASLPAIDPAAVRAVVVVRDAEDWLQDQVDALAALNPRPGHITAVDLSSTDESPAILERARDAGVLDALVSVERDTSLADAAGAAINDDAEWIWILHDDSMPDPEALGELLEAGSYADVLYPKLLAPRRRNYPDVIVEAGQSITWGGSRVGTHEAGEIDQQQIEPGAVLGGSSAGMFVRGDAWRELSGLSPEVPGDRVGVDFGWRANEAGWRVVTAPRAAIVDMDTRRNRERASDEHPHFTDRLAALRIVGARGAGGMGLMFGSWWRALGFLLARAPGHAAAELRAHRRYISTGDVTAALKARVDDESVTHVEDSYVEELLAPKHWVAKDLADRLGGAFMDRYRSFSGSDTSLDDLTSDEYTQIDATERRVSPLLLLFGLFLVAGVGAGWRLWGLGALSGGGLLPAPDTVAAAWDAYAADGAPWLGFAATVGTVLFGNPHLANFFLVLLSPVLAALTFHSMLRSVGVRQGLAAAAGALWGAALFALGLPAAGDVSGLVIAVAGPLLVKAGLQIALQRETGAAGLRASARAGFWLFVVASFFPLVLPVATVLAIVLIAVFRRKVMQLLTPVAAAWLLMVPWLPTLFREPSRWLMGADPLAWPVVPPAGLALLAGRIVPNGVPLWLSVGFVVALGLLGPLALTRIPQAWRAWLAAAWIGAGLLVGAGLSRLALTYDGSQTRALLTVPALAILGGVIVAIVLAERPRDREHRSVFVKAAAVVALAVAVAWPVIGFRGPVDTQMAQLPAYAYDTTHSPRASRALMIQKDDGVLSWNVVDDERPRWGSGERSGAFEAEFEELVQAFAGDNVPDDLSERLRALAVSHVWLDGFSRDELLSVGNAAGLTSSAASDTATTFTVTGLVSRAKIVDGDTTTPVVDGQAPAGGEGRTLVLSEPDGRALEVKVGGAGLPKLDGQTYDLGAKSGELQVKEPERRWAMWWTGIGFAFLALLAAPTLTSERVPRRAGEERR